jgi:uncharacterized membrane protein YfcA
LEFFILHLGAFIIGLAKAGFGGGLGMIVTPLWVLVISPREAVGLMLPLLLIGDIATLSFYWRGWDRRNILALFPGAVIGILIGMQLMGALPDREFKLVIGILALVFGIAQGIRQHLVTEAVSGKLWVGFFAGIGTGTISALAHLGGLITTLYLLPQHLANRTFVATSTVVFFLINATKVPAYIANDLITRASLIQDLAYIPAVILGAVVGVAVNKRIPRKQFAYIVLFFVLATGVKLVWDYAAVTF